MKIEDFTWEIKPPNQRNRDAVWMDQLSKLRGELFYDEGRRPAFLNASGEYEDIDEFESISTHILTYAKEQLIGAVRFLPLKASAYRCIASTIAGHDKFKVILQALFPSLANLVELNRLVVHKDYHDCRLGIYLCAAVFVLADDLNYSPVANGNIHVLSSFHLKHLGGVLFPKYAGPYSSRLYNDNEIYFLYFDKKRYSDFFIRHMEKMRTIIPFEMIEENLGLERADRVKAREPVDEPA